MGRFPIFLFFFPIWFVLSRKYPFNRFAADVVRHTIGKTPVPLLHRHEIYEQFTEMLATIFKNKLHVIHVGIIQCYQLNRLLRRVPLPSMHTK